MKKSVTEIRKMRGEGRKVPVYWQVFCGWLTNLIFLVQGLLLIPLYIHFLGDRLYGFWLGSGGILTWMSLFDSGVSVITKQRCSVALAANDDERIVGYFRHGAAAFGLVLVIAGLVLAFLTVHISDWLSVDGEYRDLVTWSFGITGVATLLTLAGGFLKAVAVALQKSKIPLLSETLGTLLSLVVIVVSLVYFEQGLWSLVYGALVRSSLPFLVNIVYVPMIVSGFGVGSGWSTSIARDYLVNTPSVIGSKMAGGFANSLPQILITRFIGPEATVVYSVSMRVLQILQGFINRFTGALVGSLSHLFADHATSDLRKASLVRRISTTFGLGSGIAFLLYCILNRGFISLWVGPEFFAGQLFTSLAAVAIFLVMRNNLLVAIGVAIGALRQVQNIQTGEHLLKAACIATGIYGLGIEGALMGYIVAALAVQPFYRSTLLNGNALIRSDGGALFWMWLPLTALVVLVHPLQAWIPFESWLSFLLFSVAAGFPFGLIMVAVIPELRERIRRAAHRSGFGRLVTGRA